MLNWVYLLSGVAVLGLSFFFLMRSVDKKLADLKSKPKKKR